MVFLATPLFYTQGVFVYLEYTHFLFKYINLTKQLEYTILTYQSFADTWFCTRQNTVCACVHSQTFLTKETCTHSTHTTLMDMYTHTLHKNLLAIWLCQIYRLYIKESQTHNQIWHVNVHIKESVNPHAFNLYTSSCLYILYVS